jgi:tRNA(Ile)-lysidine synthase
LAGKLLRTIRREGLLKPGDRVAAAVSGGGDSVALLLLLVELRAELGIVLSVAHVNHKLRGEESEEDQRFVTELAQRHGLELYTQEAPLGEAKSGIEAAARKLRYDFFRQLARENRVSRIATAHTLDDQAETVLLRMLRGTGIRGLSGIHRRVALEGRGQAGGEVVRPLLGFRSAELAAFLGEREQPWREDSSNRDLGFLRNRVRHRVLPLLQENFGSALAENLADLAEIARAEEEHWELVHPEIRASDDSVGIASLLSLPVAAQRRLIRGWLENNDSDLAVSFRLIEEVLQLARGAGGERIELPGGRMLRYTRRGLVLDPAAAEHETYEYRLSIPGGVEVRELGIRFEAVIADRNSIPQAERERLLDPARLPHELVVRNWRAGDRFWPAHTKAAKKVKELLSDRHLTGLEKRLWPVAVAERVGLVWMRGFPTPDGLQCSSGSGRVLWIHEIETN